MAVINNKQDIVQFDFYRKIEVISDKFQFYAVILLQMSVMFLLQTSAYSQRNFFPDMPVVTTYNCTCDDSSNLSDKINFVVFLSRESVSVKNKEYYKFGWGFNKSILNSIGFLRLDTTSIYHDLVFLSSYAIDGTYCKAENQKLINYTPTLPGNPCDELLFIRLGNEFTPKYIHGIPYADGTLIQLTENKSDMFMYNIYQTKFTYKPKTSFSYYYIITKIKLNKRLGFTHFRIKRSDGTLYNCFAASQ